MKIQVHTYGRNSNRAPVRILEINEFKSLEEAQKFADEKNDFSVFHGFQEVYLIEECISNSSLKETENVNNRK
jgi:hypothetical protein